MKIIRLKAFVLFLLVISSLCLYSCTSWGFGTDAPHSNIDNVDFENDTYLIIDRILLNKTTGKHCMLKVNEDAVIPGINSVDYYGSYNYKYEFEESSFKQYTFLETYTYNKIDQKKICEFRECILTFNYEGQEIDRFYTGKVLTEEQVKEFYKEYEVNTEAFSFVIDPFDSHSYKNATATEQIILDYAKEVYKKQTDTTSEVHGTAKPIGDEIWFSINISNDLGFDSGIAIIEGFHTSEIKAYNPESKEFRTIFEYSKKEKKIIDFDENGIYVYGSNQKLTYVDYETKKSTLINDFSKYVTYFTITDDYIFAYYWNGPQHYLFTYQKGGSIISGK